MPRKKSVEQIDREIADLRQQRREAVRRESTAARKARDHATFVAGGLLLSCFENGWESVDWERLARVIEKNRDVFSRLTTDTLPTNEASQRLREWERRQRKGPVVPDGANSEEHGGRPDASNPKDGAGSASDLPPRTVGGFSNFLNEHQGAPRR
ncbi:MAG: hypothetical protein ACI4B6_07935 [Atopobiaceae bacterium]